MAALARICELSVKHPFFKRPAQPQKGTDLRRARLDHLLEQQPAGITRKIKDKLALAPLPTGPSTRLKAATKLQVWSLGRNSSGRQREKSLVMIDFITKPWAQKTYALAGKNSLPVNQKAAKIVASKIPGGTSALVMYAQESIKEKAAKGQSKARVFRDPARYQEISDALMDTIYDIRSPEESTKDIINSLRGEEQ